MEEPEEQEERKKTANPLRTKPQISQVIPTIGLELTRPIPQENVPMNSQWCPFSKVFQEPYKVYIIVLTSSYL